MESPQLNTRRASAVLPKRTATLVARIKRHRISTRMEPLHLQTGEWGIESEMLAAFDDPDRLEEFLRFVEAEYVEGNLLFWLDAEDYRTTESELADRQRRARAIYDCFVDPDSETAVAFEADIREATKAGLEEAPVTLFETAQSVAMTLMQEDFKRFIMQSGKFAQQHHQAELRKMYESKRAQDCHLYGATTRKLTIRDHIVKEILMSERAYVDCLDKIITVFLQPLREAIEAGKPIMKEKHVSSLFGNIEEIARLNRVLCSQLEGRIVRKWSDTTLISDLFIELTPKLSVYHPYIGNHEHAMIDLAKLQKKDRKVSDFLSAQVVTGDTGEMLLDLSALLITPIQRPPRYELLLRDLIKETPEDHVDYAGLQQALASVREANMLINTKVADQDDVRQVFYVHRNMIGYPHTLVKANRRLVKEGKVRFDGVKANYLLLFNDLLIWTQKSFSSYSHRYVGEISLEKPLVVSDLNWFQSDGEGENAGFRLMMPDKSFTLMLACREESAKHDWILTLKQALKECRRMRVRTATPDGPSATSPQAMSPPFNASVTRTRSGTRSTGSSMSQAFSPPPTRAMGTGSMSVPTSPRFGNDDILEQAVNIVGSPRGSRIAAGSISRPSYAKSSRTQPADDAAASPAPAPTHKPAADPKPAATGLRASTGNIRRRSSLEDMQMPEKADAVTVLWKLVQNSANVSRLEKAMPAQHSEWPAILAHAHATTGATLLHLAVQHSHEAAVRFFLRKGAIVDAADANGRTPLLYAARGKNVRIIDMLAEAGATMTPVDSYGQTMLHIAIANGRSPVMHWILNRPEGKRMIVVPDVKKETPLHKAARRCDEEAVEALIALAAPVTKNGMDKLPSQLCAMPPLQAKLLAYEKKDSKEGQEQAAGNKDTLHHCPAMPRASWRSSQLIQMGSNGGATLRRFSLLSGTDASSATDTSEPSATGTTSEGPSGGDHNAVSPRRETAVTEDDRMDITEAQALFPDFLEVVMGSPATWSLVRDVTTNVPTHNRARSQFSSAVMSCVEACQALDPGVWPARVRHRVKAFVYLSCQRLVSFKWSAALLSSIQSSGPCKALEAARAYFVSLSGPALAATIGVPLAARRGTNLCGSVSRSLDRMMGSPSVMDKAEAAVEAVSCIEEIVSHVVEQVGPTVSMQGEDGVEETGTFLGDVMKLGDDERRWDTVSDLRVEKLDEENLSITYLAWSMVICNGAHLGAHLALVTILLEEPDPCIASALKWMTKSMQHLILLHRKHAE